MFKFLFSPIIGNTVALLKEVILLLRIMIGGGVIALLLLFLNLIANMVRR